MGLFKVYLDLLNNPLGIYVVLYQSFKMISASVRYVVGTMKLLSYSSNLLQQSQNEVLRDNMKMDTFPKGIRIQSTHNFYL